ncbi:MAG: exodeoxyribonuclease VII large subunit, partial [Hyphomicrobium sp.]|nr:exodeoxyribonuclease VII large subunit [Hyphomicrobium sp.]
ETDTTLIDFAADRRAPTPTAAAEMAVPVRAELLAMFDDRGRRLGSSLKLLAGQSAERLGAVTARWPDPARLFEPPRGAVGELGARLPRALAARAAHARADLGEVAPRLRMQLVAQRIERGQERLASLWRLAGMAHPERPLQRGFVRVTDRSGKSILHAGDAREAALLSLRFADGSVDATVDGATAQLERASPRSYRPAKPKGGATPQPGLFDD